MLSDKQISEKVKLSYAKKFKEHEEVRSQLVDYILSENDDRTTDTYKSISKHKNRLETEINILETILEINQ
jgi:hypothetical protein